MMCVCDLGARGVRGFVPALTETQGACQRSWRSLARLTAFVAGWLPTDWCMAWGNRMGDFVFWPHVRVLDIVSTKHTSQGRWCWGAETSLFLELLPSAQSSGYIYSWIPPIYLFTHLKTKWENIALALLQIRSLDCVCHHDVIAAGLNTWITCSPQPLQRQRLNASERALWMGTKPKTEAYSWLLSLSLSLCLWVTLLYTKSTQGQENEESIDSVVTWNIWSHGQPCWSLHTHRRSTPLHAIIHAVCVRRDLVVFFFLPLYECRSTDDLQSVESSYKALCHNYRC